jgi:hypothetical protein
MILIVVIYMCVCVCVCVCVYVCMYFILFKFLSLLCRSLDSGEQFGSSLGKWCNGFLFLFFFNFK